jgi:hypothetical protein
LSLFAASPQKLKSTALSLFAASSQKLKRTALSLLIRWRDLKLKSGG